MQRVFVLDTNKRPLAPCRPSRARKLLNAGKAAVFKRYPFTIILKHAVSEADPKPLRLKIDPGSRLTGLAILNDQSGEVVFAAELKHRGYLIKKRLYYRRAARRSRRRRHTRYRKPRFLNRRRPKGWLPPSLQHRVLTIQTWVGRLQALCNIQSLSQELVRFDTQLMENPNISGMEYQQGTLAGWELREYLLEKWQRKCAYCGATGVPLDIDHIYHRSIGSNRESNLTLTCNRCNQLKGTQSVEVFLRKKPELLRKILSHTRRPLHDVAAVNATRWALYRALGQSGLPVETGSGGLTKFNRSHHKLPKTNWTDAACVGRSTPKVLKTGGVYPLHIISMGHGSREMCRTDKYGFPRTAAKGAKVVRGFRTGDIVKAAVLKGKYAGTHVGRVAVKADGYFHMKTTTGAVKWIAWRCCKKIQSADGYAYHY